MKTRRIIEDISFGRFIKELKYYCTKYPKAILTGSGCGDSDKAENAFMFWAVIEYSDNTQNKKGEYDE